MKLSANRLSGTTLLIPLYLIWKKAKRKSIVVVLAVSIVLAGCFQHYYRIKSTNSIDEAALQQLMTANKYFIIHYNGKTMGVKNITVKGETVNVETTALPPHHSKHINVEGNPPSKKAHTVKKIDKQNVLLEVHLYTNEKMADSTILSLPLSSFYRVDVYEFDKSTTTINHILSWLGVTYVGLSVIGLIAFAIACNCPQVYVNNNGQYEFTSGVYSGAVYSALERTDYLPLPSLTQVDNKYQFRIGNVPEEEQFINRVQLLSIEHPADVKVLADRNGKIFTYANTAVPATATYDQGIDVVQQLKFTDGQYYPFNSSAGNDGFSAVTMSFNKPANAIKGKLLVHAGNSKWSGYLYKEFGSLFGKDYEKWRQQQEKSTAANPEQWQIDQALPLKVFVETNAGWQYVDHFALTGNTASRDMIMEIDLSAVKSDKVNIKIESTFRFWDLDMAAMDFSENATVKTFYQEANSVVKNDGTDNYKEVLQKDKQYCHLVNKDHITLGYEASASNVNTSFFLVSTGYYHNLQKFEGNADLKALMQFKEKGYFDRFSRNKFNSIQETLAKGSVK